MKKINWAKAGKNSGVPLVPGRDEPIFTAELDGGAICVTCGQGAYEKYVEVAEANRDGRTGCVERYLYNSFGWALTEGRQYIATKSVRDQREAERALGDIVNFLQIHRGA